MPSWRQQLDDRAIASLVLHVESLSPRFAQEPRLPEDVIVPTDVTSPCATPEAFVQGKSVYEQMRCAECHGDSGRGDGPAAATAMNSDGTPGHVFDFTSGRFKGGKRATDVYRTFMTGLDGSPMPAYDQSVPDEAQRWALVHYVLGLERPRTWRDWLLDRPQWHEP
jgi:cytochrome c oxidase cbb3-type subunit 2